MITVFKQRIYRFSKYYFLFIVLFLISFLIYLSYTNYFNTLFLNIYPLSFKDQVNITNSSTKIADYTLLIYMIGSDFESKKYSATDDIKEIKEAGITSNITIVLQTGGGINSENSNDIDFSKVQRHQIVNGTIHTLKSLGYKNMAEPNTLSDFIKWGISEFPAKKYAIIFWDHGSGIHGFGKDINFNNDELSPFELFKGFYDGLNNMSVSFDLIGFDACLMSSLETASRLFYFSPYMVASEEVVPEWGWNYTSIIKGLTSNPNQSGYLLGKSIIDSYSNSSKHLSKSEKFGTDKEITLSLIDMNKIPQLVKDVNSFSIGMKSKISSLDYAINLSKDIDLTERYGQSGFGSTGLIDLYDLTTNIIKTDPDLESYIKAIQKSIKSAVVYSYKGTARPNANGISIYMPLLKNEYSNKAELQVIDTDWLTLLYTQRSMIEYDKLSPVIKSIREGNTIKGSIYGSDIANIFVEIITNSSHKNNLNTSLDFVQNIEPSLFIDNHGYFKYTDHKMLVLCNEIECFPTSMNLESNRDKKFVFIPVRLESINGKVNNTASLVYEVDKDNKFNFLGVNPETNPDETIPKGKAGIPKNTKIFLESRPAKASFKNVKDIKSNNFREISEYLQGGPLLVKDPEKVIPKYVNISSPFTISFTICDYSNNCDKTRWYKINPTEQVESIIPQNDQRGYDIKAKEYNNNFPDSIKNTYTYINPTFGFKINYPSDWTKNIQNINDVKEYDLVDPLLVEFIPSKYTESPGSNYYPRLSISVTDWPYKESPKSYFDFFKNSKLFNYTLIEAENTTIADNPAFRFVIEYVSPDEQLLGVAKEKHKEMITSVIMNGKMYFITFGTFTSQFNNYLPIVEEMFNSFGPYQIQNQTESSIDRIKKLTDTQNQNETQSYRWSTYNDPLYGYSINYPSNVGLGKPFPLENENSNIIGNLFILANSSDATPEAKEAAQVIIETFYKNETDRLNKIIIASQFGSLLQNFDLKNIQSIVNNELSFFKLLPNFEIIQNKTLNYKNNIAYIIEISYYNPNFRSIMQEKKVYITNGEELAILDFMSNPQKYHQYLPIFQKMVDSFEFQNNNIN